jgi:hypothetical protein
MASAKKEVMETFGKGLVKEGKSAKNAFAEVQLALAAVSHELKGTTKNAKEYGDAVAADTKAVLDFAKKNKLTLDESMAMYKKARTGLQEYKDTQDKIKGGQEELLGRLKTWGAGLITLGGAAVVYNNRVREMREGQQLFLSQGNAGWQDLQKTVDGFRDAQRDASIVAHRYGVSTEEVQDAQKGLAKGLRGTITDQGKLGEILKRDTEKMYQFSRVMGVDVKEAQDLYIDQIRQQGKTHAEADRSLGVMITAYDRMAERVGNAGQVQKDEYLAVIKDMQNQLGPTQISLGALTSSMDMFSEAAKNAGMNAKQTQDFMGALPKISKGLPRFFKQQIGSDMLRAFKKGPAEFIQKMTEGMDTKQAEMVKKQLETAVKSGRPIWEQQERFQEILSGSTKGMAANLKIMADQARTMPAVAANTLAAMGMSPDQVDAFLAGAKDGTLSPAKLEEMAKKMSKEGKEGAKDPRQTMNENLEKNASMADKLTMKTEEARGQLEALGKQNQELGVAIGGLVTAIQLLTAVQGAGGVVGVTKALIGKFGSMGGAAKGVIGSINQWGGALTGSLGSIAKFGGGAAAAGAAGYAFGTWLDKKFGLSDKISDAAVAPIKKASQLKRSRERGQEWLAGQTARIAQQAERVKKYGRSTLMTSKGEVQEATAENIKAKELGFLKHSLKQGDLNQAQFEILVKALDDSLKKFPTPQKAAEARKPEEQKKVAQLQQTKAENREEKARAKMQVGPEGRAQVPGQALKQPSSAEAAQPSANQGVASATATPGSQQPTQQTFDQATGTWILQISTRDPAYQQMMQQSVASAQQSMKRAR